MMDDLHEYLNEFFDLGKPRHCAVGENWFVPVKDDMFLQLIIKRFIPQRLWKVAQECVDHLNEGDGVGFFLDSFL